MVGGFNEVRAVDSKFATLKEVAVEPVVGGFDEARAVDLKFAILKEVVVEPFD